MKYFFDTEFHEFNYNLAGKKCPTNTIELISIGIVREDGKEFYAVSKDFNVEKAFSNAWLAENVLSPILDQLKSENLKSAPYLLPVSIDEKVNLATLILNCFASTQNEIKMGILEFVGDDENPEFYAYYADYDWVCFCWLFGRMIDLPKGFPMLCWDLKQMLDAVIERSNQGYEDSPSGDVGITLEDLKRHPDYPKQENEHNALDDARWNKSLFEFLQNL